MTIESALALGIASLIFAATPGPAVLACVAHGLSSEFRSSLGLISGIIVGDLVYLLFAVYGLAALAQVMGSFFLGVKILGGLYLLWMGVDMWRKDPTPLKANAGLQDRVGMRGFWAGLLMTMGNPKVMIFYIGFLPAFINLEALASIDVAVVAAVIVASLVLVNVVYTWSADRLARMVSSRSATRNLNRTAGTAMIGAGVAVLAK